MQLVPNWRTVLRRAWSVRLGVMAGLLAGLDFVLQALVGAGSGPSWLLYLSGLVAAAAFISRFIAQPKMNEDDEDGE